MIDGLLLLAVLVGLVAGGFLVSRSPTFWVGLAMVVWMKVYPMLLRRMPPEDEKKIRDAALRGEDTTKLWFELKRKRNKQK